jgi:cytosine/creatinine deaminase
LVDLVIANAGIAGRPGTFTIEIDAGKIVGLDPAGGSLSARRIDARGGMVTPSFVEPHFHLDKTLSRHLFGATTPAEAFSRARDVKRHFTVEDVEARASQALRLAAAHGIGTMRAQCDVDHATRLISFEGLLRARERFRGIVDLQIVAFPQEGIVTDPEAPGLLRQALQMGADAVGGLPEFERTEEDQLRHITVIFDLAEEFDVPIDMHVDYTDVADLKTLEKLVDLTIQRGHRGRVVAGHCNALAVYPDEEARRVIDKVKAADIDVVVMPIANLQMLGGPLRTPYNRGSSRTKELLDAGVNVAAAMDNMNDIWYRFGHMDPVELALITCLSAGMRTDDEVGQAFEMVTSRPAQILNAGHGVIEVGAPADLVVFEATNVVDLLRNVPSRRTVLKAGRVVAGIDADYWVRD